MERKLPKLALQPKVVNLTSYSVDLFLIICYVHITNFVMF